MWEEYPHGRLYSRMTTWRNGLASSTVCTGGAVLASSGLFIADAEARPVVVGSVSDHGRDGHRARRKSSRGGVR